MDEKQKFDSNWFWQYCNIFIISNYFPYFIIYDELSPLFIL